MFSTRFSPMTARPIRPMSAVAAVIAEAPESGSAASRSPGLPEGLEVRTDAEVRGHCKKGRGDWAEPRVVPHVPPRGRVGPLAGRLGSPPDAVGFPP